MADCHECSCHINPPCQQCVDCEVCNVRDDDEAEANEHVEHVPYGAVVIGADGHAYVHPGGDPLPIGSTIPTPVVWVESSSTASLADFKPTGYFGAFRNKDGLKVVFSKNWDTGETYSRVLSLEEEKEADRAFFSDEVDDD